jgi:RNA polymerase sigma-70 factor (sigma-E family)
MERAARPDDDAVDRDDEPALPRRRGGTPEGFADFYRSTQPGMIRLAYLLTGAHEVAADLTQDAFVALHARWGSIDDPLAYVRRSVVNACRSHHRRAAMRRRRTPIAMAGLGAPIALEADELFDALSRLSARERAAIVLRFYEDLSERDAASALGCRPGTVGSLVHRGLEHLREEIER